MPAKTLSGDESVFILFHEVHTSRFAIELREKLCHHLIELVRV